MSGASTAGRAASIGNISDFGGWLSSSRYASVLLEAGESVVAVAERLGHENANLVLTTYGHLMPDTEDRTRKAVDSAWSRSPQVPHGRL